MFKLVKAVLLVVTEKRWAEWVTLIVTASFVPIEVYELARHESAVRVGTLVLNVVVVE